MKEEPKDRLRTTRSQRRVLAFAVGLLVLTASIYREGIFNNRGDWSAAVEEHNSAWRACGLSDVIDRAQAISLIGDYDGSCFFEHGARGSVDLTQPFAHADQQQDLVACYFDVISRQPWKFLKTYRWTVLLDPLPDGRFKVIALRRNSSTF